MDVDTAFLNVELDEDQQRSTWYGLQAAKSLHGLKQTARCWNKIIDQYFKDSGYVQSDVDPSIYYKRVEILNTEHLVIMAVYADDLLIDSNGIQLLKVQKRKMSKRFNWYWWPRWSPLLSWHANQAKQKRRCVKKIRYGWLQTHHYTNEAW